jgi:hypothetical protein
MFVLLDFATGTSSLKVTNLSGRNEIPNIRTAQASAALVIQHKFLRAVSDAKAKVA